MFEGEIFKIKSKRTMVVPDGASEENDGPSLFLFLPHLSTL